MDGLVVLVGVLGSLVALLLLGEAIQKRIRAATRSPEERALFERARSAVPRGAVGHPPPRGCSNCTLASLTLPYRDNAGRRYCSEDCLLWGALGPTRFCEACIAASRDQSSGDMRRINGIGTAFGARSQRCVTCRSVVRRVWFTLLLVPVVPLKRYRVIHQSPRQFWTRQARDLG